MKKKLIIIIIAMLFVFAGDCVFGQKRTPKKKDKKKSEKAFIKSLPEKYRKWYELVTHIITDAEKSTFRRLSNDRDRDVFVNLFWNLRDPTPQTEVNEYRQEHIERFEYADKYYKYGAPREGWKTDMGKIYIILGKPESIDRYEMDSDVVPVQIWSYYGKKRRGLPPSFWIVFFKKDELGEYRIYNPASDGPYSLLRKKHNTSDLDPFDHEANYTMINDEHPILAKASLSLIPNEAPYNFTPTLRSQQLLGEVISHPRKLINDGYATNFLKYKGQVDVDYSMNYIEAQHKVAVYKNPETGINLINFAIRPKEISAETTGESGNFSFRFDMTVSLKKGDVSIFEYRKQFPFSGSRAELLEKFSNSLIFSDCFPAAEGDYRLSVLLQNLINKEFTYFDTDISIKPETFALPVVSGPFISGTVNRINRMAFVPFKFRDVEITLDPRKIFGKEDKIFVIFALDRGKYNRAFKVNMEVRSLTGPEKYKKSYPVQLEPGKTIHFINRELEPLDAGYYEVHLRLEAAGGALLAEKQDDFTVSHSAHVPATSNIYRSTSFENKFLYYHIVGLQYMRLNQLAKAETFLSKAFNMRPTYPPFIKDYAFLLLKMKKAVKVHEIIVTLGTVEKYRFDYYALKGRAFSQQEEYKQAIEVLRKANEIYDSDISVLNVLGLAYLKTGNKAEAIKVFSSSLKINDQQPNIAKILDDLK